MGNEPPELDNIRQIGGATVADVDGVTTIARTTEEPDRLLIHSFGPAVIPDSIIDVLLPKFNPTQHYLGL